MQIKERTKKSFADALIQMLETMPLEKVRVTALCKRCGTVPATFYYYFRDKYDLVSWIYLQDISTGPEDGPPDFSPDSLAVVNERLHKRKTFYQKAFSDQSQNSLREYMQATMIQGARDVYKSVTGEEMPRRELVEVKYYVLGIIELFRDWLFDGGTELEDIGYMVVAKKPELLQTLFERFSQALGPAPQAES